MSKLRKYLIVVLVALIVVETVAAGVAYLRGRSLNLNPIGAISANQVRFCHGRATTSPEWMATTEATSTCTFVTSGLNTLSLNIHYTASSTGALVWRYEASENNIDWYPLDEFSLTAANSATQLITHQATSTLHQWTPSGIATTTKRVRLSGINSQYLRLLYNAKAADGAVWIQGIMSND